MMGRETEGGISNSTTVLVYDPDGGYSYIVVPQGDVSPPCLAGNPD